MRLLFASLCLGLLVLKGIHGKSFPCNFNMYENIRDGRITADEFFTYSKTHELDIDDSKVAFGIFDKNADGQIEVSEFLLAVPMLQRKSMIGPCARSFTFTAGITITGK